MSKGERTRNRILDQALDLASVIGLEGLTIGTLARHTGTTVRGPPSGDPPGCALPG